MIIKFKGQWKLKHDLLRKETTNMPFLHMVNLTMAGLKYRSQVLVLPIQKVS